MVPEKSPKPKLEDVAAMPSSGWEFREPTKPGDHSASPNPPIKTMAVILCGDFAGFVFLGVILKKIEGNLGLF